MIHYAKYIDVPMQEDRPVESIDKENKFFRLGTPKGPIRTMRVGIGTDSKASNNSLDMFREMKKTASIQYWDPAAKAMINPNHPLFSSSVPGRSPCPSHRSGTCPK